MPKRATSTSFPKGVSGNPSGRPKIPSEVKELAKQYTVEAIEMAAKWMRQEVYPMASIAGIETILNRGHGRPVQTTNLRKITCIGDLTDEELLILSAEEDAD